MRVADLIEYLESQNPDADVRMQVQPNWPFETTISGACTQSCLLAIDGDSFDPTEPGATKPDTVFLIQGSQLKYGNKAAWELG
jgi:hypothetical protein